jgi:hypothetical protein
MLSLCALTVAMSVVSQPRLAVHVEKTTLPEAAALDRELRGLGGKDFDFLPSAATGVALKALNIPSTPDGVVRAIPELGVVGVVWVRILDRKTSVVAQVQVFGRQSREVSIVSSGSSPSEVGQAIATELMVKLRKLFASQDAPKGATAVQPGEQTTSAEPPLAASPPITSTPSTPAPAFVEVPPTARPSATPDITTSAPQTSMAPSSGQPNPAPPQIAPAPGKRIIMLGCSFREENQAVWVGRVVAGSPAEKAKLRAGLRLSTLNGQPIPNKAWLIDRLASLVGQPSLTIGATDESGQSSAHAVDLSAAVVTVPAEAAWSAPPPSSAGEVARSPDPLPAPASVGGGHDDARASGAPSGTGRLETTRPAAAPGQVTKTQSSLGSVPGGGLSAGYTEETLKKRVAIPSSVGSVALSLAGIGIFGDTFNAGGGGVDLRLSRLWASFPGESGGSFVGFSLGARLSGFALAGSSNVVVPGFGSFSNDILLFRGEAAAEAGLVIMGFGAMNPETLEQHGFGVRLAGFAGASLGVQSIDGVSGEPEVSPVYGPLLALEFPSYNAGTADYSAFSIFGLVIPTGSSVTVSGSLSFAF